MVVMKKDFEVMLYQRLEQLRHPQHSNFDTSMGDDNDQDGSRQVEEGFHKVLGLFRFALCVGFLGILVDLSRRHSCFVCAAGYPLLMRINMMISNHIIDYELIEIWSGRVDSFSIFVTMVDFGKTLMENQVQEWKQYYINYKLMEREVKQFAQHAEQGRKDRRRVLKDFSKMLDDQIEKAVLFFLEQQGILACRIQELGEQRVKLLEQPDISKISELRGAYASAGHDLLKLLRFLSLNATGIRKILKKFDKRFGFKFTDYYLSTRSNHPYSQLKQVFKHVGIAAVVGALSRNLADLQEREGSYLSIYDQPSTALMAQDPVISLIHASVDKLTRSTNFLQYLGQHALIVQADAPTSEEDQVADEKYHFMSLLLNLASTYLYMVNTYIIVPTADDYSMSLGAAATVCGVVIGSMAIAQVFSSVYFSAWSNRSYFRPLVFSSTMLVLGNILYALAYNLDSLTILLIGRLLCGMGSARAVNRRYISDCVPLKIRMQASAGFVSASALGMACGPALAGLLQTNFKVYGLTINQDTLPGWVMAIAWLAYLIWLWISFKEPVIEHLSPDSDAAGLVDNETSEGGLVQPLLIGSEQIQNKNGDEECNDSDEASEDARKPATSVASAYRLLTPSIKVQLLIYFMLKYAMEILLSESSVITSYYFGWSTSSVAIFLAILGLTVLPVNAIVGTYISNMFEDRQILLGSEILVLAGILLSFKFTSSYTVPQYVCSALITFVAAEVLEGVNLSLLSQVMSSRLARGTYNGGLLSTEAGTLARVVADGTITLAGYLGESKLLNVTLFPSLLICISSIVATCLTYNSLF
ncbi:SPX domain-containing membrane protein [Canna indica]|uniref:SPX domain-containing membrane protein n=1 Tax=Canna indica TaxID=4628 RepID=A0AAQ3K076_9LILI|nr:SPX domain-containing membrane protein [Canna indica]